MKTLLFSSTPSSSAHSYSRLTLSPMSLVLKIPLLAVAAIGTWYALTPPQPAPRVQERVKSEGVERSFGNVVRMHAHIWKVSPQCHPTPVIAAAAMAHLHVRSLLYSRASSQSSSLVYSSRPPLRYHASPSSSTHRRRHCRLHSPRHCLWHSCWGA
jgi:hypothetical protein